MPPNPENTSQEVETNDLILQKVGDLQGLLEMVLVKIGQRESLQQAELDGMREQFGSLIDDLKKKYSSAEIVQMLLGSEELDALIDKKLPDRITNTDTVTVREEVPEERLALIKKEVLVEARRSLRERMDRILPTVINEEIRKAFSTYRVAVKDIDGLNDLIQERLEKVYETIQKFSRHSGGGSLELHKLKDVDVTGLADGMVLKYSLANKNFYFGTGGGGVTDHGALTGLGDDDHPQYHNDARGDARYQQLSQKDTANGYAGLDAGGKINPSQLPALAITDTFVVASQAAQTALSAEVGDVAVRTDQNKSYILKTAPASVFANWQELLTPTDTVTSVFGRSGPVTAQNGDYNTSQVTESGNLYFTEPRVRATVLTGLGLTAGIVAATDSILQALGKIGAIVNAMTGGTTGQVLKKNSNTAFDFSWQTDNTGGGGGATATEVEIDFGTMAVPITSWTITDAGIDPTKKILVFPSPNPATDRLGNDWELDSAVFTGLAGSGNFALSAIPTTRMVGKRKIYYQVV